MPYTHDTTGTEVAANLSSQIKDKTVLITGVSPNGLGAAFATIIAAQSPRLLILAARNPTKAAETASAVQAINPKIATRVLELDLSSQASVRKAAKEVLAYPADVDGGAIDALVLNAGIMGNPQYSTTAEGIEAQFGTNHIGHFLFTNLVMEKVRAARDGGRVVSVSSSGHRLGWVRFEDLGFDGGKSYHAWHAYGQSKTANMLFAVSLAEKLGRKGLVAVSLHPGIIQTNLADNSSAEWESLIALDKQLGFASGLEDFENLPWKSLDQGAATHVRAAFDPALKEYNGRYLEDSEVLPEEKVRAWARDKLEAEMLWKVSEELVGQKFEY